MSTNNEDETLMELTPKGKKTQVSNEKRLNIIEALKSGTVTRAIASKTFNVNYNTICWIYRKYCLEGITQTKPKGGNNPAKMHDTEILFMKKLLEENCTLSLRNIKKAVYEEFHINVSIATIHKFIDNFGFSLKRVSLVAAVSISDDMRERRLRYAAWFLKIHNSQKNILFYDETGFQVVMRNLYGRSKKGKKAICEVPSIKSRNITVMATMSADGLLSYDVLNGPCNRSHLYSYLEKLIQVLTNLNLNNVTLIMDNASFHKCAEIRDLIAKSGHDLEFLPAYSPFFNPIENMFSQWKKIVRNIAPKNEEELLNAIGSFKAIITKDQCQNYYRNIVNNHIDCLNGKNVFDI